jgi:hypothetical protein
MQVTAIKEFPYGDKMRKIGETFEMSEDDARLMVGFGKVNAGEQKSRRQYRRRDMVAQDHLES